MMAATVKFLFCGSDGVGKTTILRQFVDNAGFEEAYNTTLGVDLLVRRFKSATLQFWDTGGHAIYNDITYSYYPGADCIVYVYDATAPKTLLQIEEMYKHLLRGPNASTPVVLIANKSDLGRTVPMARVRKTFSCPHYEICAKHRAEVALTLSRVVERHCSTHMVPNPLSAENVIRLGVRDCVGTGCCV